MPLCGGINAPLVASKNRFASLKLRLHTGTRGNWLWKKLNLLQKVTGILDYNTVLCIIIACLQFCLRHALYCTCIIWNLTDTFIKFMCKSLGQNILWAAEVRKGEGSHNPRIF